MPRAPLSVVGNHATGRLIARFTATDAERGGAQGARDDAEPQDDARPGCRAPAGLPPTSGGCGHWLKNAWWLPMPYVVNTLGACMTTPNTTTANCIRQHLRDRVEETPLALKLEAAAAKRAMPGPLYRMFVQTRLVPRFARDHQDAYKDCCCPAPPAPYWAWMAVAEVPLPPPAVRLAILQTGSCHGTPGKW